MSRNVSFKKLIPLGIASAFALTTQAYASGFQLLEQDAAGAGNAYAGTAAEANSASTAFFNPAGLTRLKNKQVVVGGTAVFTDAKFDGRQDVSIKIGPKEITHFSLLGNAQGGEFSVVPNIHIALPYNDDVVFGFSVSMPFGLSTDWEENSVVRYAATRSELQVVNLSPSVGFKVSKHLSAGFGLDVQRLNLTLNEMVFTPLADSKSQNKGNSWATGWHAGLLYEIDEHSRIGLNYRSAVQHHIEGASYLTGETSDLSNFSPELNGNLRLPASTTLSAYHELNDQWALMGTVSYTQWSSINSIALNKVAGFEPEPIDINQVTDYKNTWRFAVGANYHLNDNIMLRAGASYEQTPTNDAYRDVRLPDGNRYALALGGHYQASKTIGVDAGWTHLFVQDGVIDSSVTLGEKISEKATTRGKVRNQADVFGLQLTWDVV